MSSVEATSPQSRRTQAGLWLRTLREGMGLSQNDIAEKVALTSSTFVSQVEQGILQLPSRYFNEWSIALGQIRGEFALTLLRYYDPHLHEILSEEPIELELVKIEPGSRKSIQP